MISKRIRILALTLFSCFALLGFAIGLQQVSISISSMGTIETISPIRSYNCGNYNSTHYYAQNNVTGNYELISTGASQTISYALSKLTSGRTWQETVLLKGNFSIGTTITLSQGKVLLDCRQATLTSTASDAAFDIQSSNVTIIGGHWIGPANGVIETAIRFIGSSATNCIVDGGEFEQFTSSAVGLGVIFTAYGSSYITIQNCDIHDNGGHNYGINLQGSGHHKIINCQIYGCGSGIFIANECTNNKITSCIIHDQVAAQGHFIYMDGGSSSIGNNEVSNCTLYNQVNTAAGMQIKCQNNKIHNNTFYDFTNSGGPCFSVYSQYSPSYANDNEFYNNTFTRCDSAFWIGHNPANYPALSNKIHDNTFTQVTNCIMLNPWSGAINTVEDTWIYYNHFVSCTDIFPATESSTSLIKNTVVAYNDFGGTVTDLAIEGYVNTVVYGNIGMADFNVPSPLPIPPP